MKKDLREQRNAFRRRDARQQRRLSALPNLRLTNRGVFFIASASVSW
jgi:hypothetical protein